MLFPLFVSCIEDTDGTDSAAWQTPDLEKDARNVSLIILKGPQKYKTKMSKFFLQYLHDCEKEKRKKKSNSWRTMQMHVSCIKLQRGD